MDGHEKVKGKGGRAPSVKGKKGVDESEKQIAGNGWTIAATQRILELTTVEERIQQLLQMFSVSEQDYQYSIRSTVPIDFHLANALFCIAQQFDAPKTQFVCRTLQKLLDIGIAKVQVEDPDYDEFRSQLFDHFQTAFQEWNNGENRFSIGETNRLINYVTAVFLRPLRLMLYPFYLTMPPSKLIMCRKVFQPARPVPLAECEEYFPLVPESRQFLPFPLPPNVTAVNFEDLKQMIQQYADGVIMTIETTYDTLEESVAKFTPSLTP
jgi:hypothetical protein